MMIDLAERFQHVPASIRKLGVTSTKRRLAWALSCAQDNTHCRRQFVEATANFPDECAYILQTLGRVYHNDAITRERGMTPEARLTFHQTRAAR